MTIETLESLATAEEIAEALHSIGYPCQADGNSITTRIGTFGVLLLVEDDELIVTLQLTTMGQVSEDKKFTFMAASLDANTTAAISPYAFGILSNTDDHENNDEDAWPFVLTDRVPLGDFSTQELEYVMDQLVEALTGSRDVLEIAFGDQD